MPAIIAPTITRQPASQTVPLGSMATVSVGVSGTAPFSYQWSMNGNRVSGATANALTTQAFAISNAGDRYSVTITNPGGSITSNVATLTLGPRSPDQHDLRFKHIDFVPDFSGGQQSALLAANAQFYVVTGTGGFASPIEVGNAGVCSPDPSNYSCDWLFSFVPSPSGVPGFNFTSQSNALAALPTELAKLSDTGVLTAIDEHPDLKVFAFSYEQDPGATGTFALQRIQAGEPTLQALVQALANQGAVVTAISTDNTTGLLDVFAYTWTGAASTTYDTSTAFATFSDVEQQGAALAANGYMITAVGAGFGSGFVLVGTKVHGDSLPRFFSITNPYVVTGNVLTEPYAPVALLFDVNGNIRFYEQ